MGRRISGSSTPASAPMTRSTLRVWPGRSDGGHVPMLEAPAHLSNAWQSNARQSNAQQPHAQQPHHRHRIIDPWKRRPAEEIMPDSAGQQRAVPRQGQGTARRRDHPRPRGRRRAGRQGRGQAPGRRRALPTGDWAATRPRGPDQRRPEPVGIPRRDRGRRAGWRPGSTAIVLPKVSCAGPRDLARPAARPGRAGGRTAARQRSRSRRRSRTPPAWPPSMQIATASPRLAALIFGPADFMASLGMRSLRIGVPPERLRGR